MYVCVCVCERERERERERARALLIPVSVHVQHMEKVTHNQKICSYDEPPKFM